jgi:hypothetical protein
LIGFCAFFAWTLVFFGDLYHFFSKQKTTMAKPEWVQSLAFRRNIPVRDIVLGMYSTVTKEENIVLLQNNQTNSILRIEIKDNFFALIVAKFYRGAVLVFSFKIRSNAVYF